MLVRLVARCCRFGQIYKESLTGLDLNRARSRIQDPHLVRDQAPLRSSPIESRHPKCKSRIEEYRYTSTSIDKFHKVHAPKIHRHVSSAGQTAPAAATTQTHTAGMVVSKVGNYSWQLKMTMLSTLKFEIVVSWNLYIYIYI